MQLTPYQPTEIKNFINRDHELRRLAGISDQGEAALVVVYGRRRVGKTVLLEKAFAKRRILKFEGLEGRPEPEQRRAVMRQLARYTGHRLVARVTVERWEDVFNAIAPYVAEGTWTVYFEEVQWLAAYRANFITELKLFWDNAFSKNPHLLMILCGSSPSFMMRHVVRSRALYNRAALELPVNAFSIAEARRFLPSRSSTQEVVEAYLSVGGVPPYLKQLSKHSSLFLSLCAESFVQGGFFVGEYERLLVSSLADNPIYRKIIAYLAMRRFADRKQLEKAVGLGSGGAGSRHLEELELCNLIERYTSFHLKSGRNLQRYCIADPYLQFYFRFIEPISAEINGGTFNEDPTRALPQHHYQIWLGYAFERFCRSQHRRIASILGFSAVRYKHGPYFRRSGGAGEPGMQLDLCFQRADKTLTICEVKYTTAPTNAQQARAFVEKFETIALPPAHRIERVLISAAGATREVAEGRYFDRIIDLRGLVEDP